MKRVIGRCAFKKSKNQRGMADEEVDNAASVKGAAWSMSVDLGMSQGDGKAKGSKKLRDEAFKQELRGKVRAPGWVAKKCSFP